MGSNITGHLDGWRMDKELIPDCWHSFRESMFTYIELSFRDKKVLETV